MSHDDLGPGGRALWDGITEAHTLSAAQRVQLLEACRQKDHLDTIDGLLAEQFDDSLVKLATTVANTMKQLLAALRLPDEVTGKVPQYRGPRGAQAPSQPGGAKVSSIERARSRKGA